jgi:serralysin
MPGTGNVLLDAIAGVGWLQRGQDNNIQYYFANDFAAHAWTTTEMAAYQAATQAFSNVANIQFTQVFSAADANFVENWVTNTYMQTNHGNFGGWHQYPNTAGQANGHYNFERLSSAGVSIWTATSLAQGGTGFALLMHEIGHGLGLAHPHDTDMGTLVLPGVTSSSSIGTNGYNQDLYTIMSYNAHPDSSSGFLRYGHAATPMAFDIAALQYLYGANTTFASGNDGYVLPGINDSGTAWRCIWDAAGVDTISYAGTQNATIDLRAATLVNGDANAGGFESRVAGIFGGFTIANGVVIENATGGSGNDTITGNAADNILTGHAGIDVLNGGDGNDTVDYSTDAALGGTTGVYVDLSINFGQDGFGANDSLLSIEYITGSNQNRSTTLGDVLIGNNANNVISGLGGLDYILGNGGADYIATGDGAITGTGDIALGGAGNDTVIGGSGATFIYGNDGSDNLSGGDGEDWLFGGDFSGVVTGTDTMQGEAGNDVLAVGSAGGNAFMYGGAGNDIIYGGSGSAGNDVIVGGAGTDYMYGVGGNDGYFFQAGDLVAGDFDTILGFDTGDYLSFATSYSGQISGQQVTFNGIAGSYLTTSAGYGLWMPYTTWTSVQTQIYYS